MSTQLPITSVVQVTINLSVSGTARNGFNLGCVIGNANLIPQNARVRNYSSLIDMISDGFNSNMAEYNAVELIFGAKPAPTNVLVGGIYNAETPLEAFQACRYADTNWFVGSYLGANKSHIEDIAAFSEAINQSIPTVQFYTTSDSDCLAGTSGNIFLTLQADKYQQSLGQYSSQNYAVCSIMGYALGAFKSSANSAYTLDLKSEPGVTPENIQSYQVNNIENANGNVYINRAGYEVFETGLMANGVHFDEVINLAKLANDCKLNVMDLLTQNPKVPQTEDGMKQLYHAISMANNQAVKTGFIVPGMWTEASILDLKTGDTLPLGYKIMSDPIDQQSSSDRKNRIAPDIYNCVKLGGAIEHAIINISVNR